MGGRPQMQVAMASCSLLIKSVMKLKRNGIIEHSVSQCSWGTRGDLWWEHHLCQFQWLLDAIVQGGTLQAGGLIQGKNRCWRTQIMFPEKARVCPSNTRRCEEKLGLHLKLENLVWVLCSPLTRFMTPVFPSLKLPICGNLHITESIRH